MKGRFCSVAVAALINAVTAAAFNAASAEPSLASAIPIITYHYNNARTGANVSETTLTPANVNMNQFGKLFSVPVDGGIYAQPLYVPNLSIPGLGTHNVVYVATQHNSLYAFDADNGATLWSVNLGPYQTRPNCTEPGDIGIIGTPVIQRMSNTIYAVAAVVRSGAFKQELHALDITTGMELSNSPRVIKASVPGTGYGSIGGMLTFNAHTEFQRPALLSDNGMLYIGFAAHCDYKPYSAQGHGWLFAYNASTLQLKSSFVVTPNGFGAGIWAGGGGPAADAYHNIYFSTGDGTFDVDQGGIDYGDSVMKLSPISLSLLDYFTPFNQASLVAHENDLGSGGVLLLPDQSTSPTHLMVTAGKQGKVYLINRDNLRHYSSTTDNVVEELLVLKGLFGTPTFWNNNLYFAGSGYSGGDYPKAFSFSNGKISKNPTSQAAVAYPYPGAVTVISANGQTNGILWAIQHGDASGNEVLHAYDATNLAHELYNSNQAPNGRDWPGLIGQQFESIIVNNGKVYVPTGQVSTGQPQLTVFGLLPAQ